MTIESTDAGTVRIVLDTPDKAREMLSEAAIAHTTAECLAVLMPNHPDGLAEVARVLSLAGVDIDDAYGSSTAGSTTALGIFGVSDLERALTYLGRG